MSDSPTLTAAEAARRLGVTRQAALKLVRRGRLMSAQPHSHAPHAIDPVDVESLAAERSRKAAARHASAPTEVAA